MVRRDKRCLDDEVLNPLRRDFPSHRPPRRERKIKAGASRRSVSEERQPNVSEGRMKTRRVETAKRVPFTPARPVALAKGDAQIVRYSEALSR